jgi:transcriptional regulator with PAS, ATPase and Fis domain
MAMNHFSRIIFSNSMKMKMIKTVIDKVAKTDLTVLIKGESGTGKELIARSIHEMSPRGNKHFLKLNCAAIPNSLLESELFGFEKGAFTGAHLKKAGKLELANGGTLLLSDIEEMDVSLQGKLLQVLQDGRFSPLGSDGDVFIDARVIVTTKNHLEKAMLEGRFREDLFYRINVININVPPLRERRDQILPLAQYFSDFYQQEYRHNGLSLSPKTARILKEYSWPGNIRELENIVKRIIITKDEDAAIQKLIEMNGEGVICEEGAMAGNVQRPLFDLKEVGKKAGEEAEKELLHTTLHETHWNRKKAARLLHISYKALLYKIEKYRLNHINPMEAREGLAPNNRESEEKEFYR